MANWIHLPSVSVTNGSITVSVTGSIDLSSVLAGWALIVNNTPIEIASGTAVGNGGVSTLTLASPWDGGTISNQPAKVQPTGAPFLAGIKAMQDTNEFAIDVHKALEEYAMQDKDVTLTAPSGEAATFASLPKIARVMQEFRDAAGSAYAHDVTESATDTTPGRLLKGGDGGLLVNTDRPRLTNINNVFTTGFYEVAGTAIGKPPFTGLASFSLTVTRIGVIDGVVQLASNSSTMGFRGYNSTTGEWSEWIEILHKSNFVGIVSQSGGVPTGAIIERGSNANGEYTKFADGTAFATIRVTLDLNALLPVGSRINNSNLSTPLFTVDGLTGGSPEDVTWNLPITLFNSTVDLSCSFRKSGSLTPMEGDAKRFSGNSFRLYNLGGGYSSGDADRITIHGTARGYWYEN